MVIRHRPLKIYKSITAIGPLNLPRSLKLQDTGTSWQHWAVKSSVSAASSAQHSLFGVQYSCIIYTSVGRFIYYIAVDDRCIIRLKGSKPTFKVNKYCFVRSQRCFCAAVLPEKNKGKSLTYIASPSLASQVQIVLRKLLCKEQWIMWFGKKKKKKT